MSNVNSYIVFEPDQVLTNDHLNELFNYLDTQERLTRNKLIGIGVVCGLEINYNALPASITISKGCGVTSYGYLVVLPEDIAGVPLTKYTTYTLPVDPLYKPFINIATSKQFDLWLLLNEDQADASEEAVNDLDAFPSLNDMVVVLFLEAVETDLKNCDTQDCNDKGKEIAFNVKPLLINKTDMDTIIINQKNAAGDDSGLSDSYIERLGLKEIPFKRFDVTATSVSDAYDIFNAYALCLDDVLLKNVAEAYSQSYSVFQPVLEGYNTNPFTDIYDFLKQRLVSVQTALPIYIQYYYDFIDDLIKAYYEFKERSFDLITECCPDEELFPMHLMLGEATVDTNDQVRSLYRQYFIYSPLFNNQQELLAEVNLLFDRMVSLRYNFFIKQYDGKTVVPVKVTPSKWGDVPLSQRAIPYYYNINSVAPKWNYQKAKKGKANTNLSYNAASYLPAAPAQIQNPLLYNIEPYNFYRIEGHVGQSYDTVLKSITDTRNYNRLPFDVIALKAGDEASNTAANKYDCNFQDLQAMYEIIKSELACKAHEPVCLVAKMPSSLQIITGGVTPAGFNFINVLVNTHSLVLNQQINPKATVLTSFVTAFYSTKGAFLKANCPIVKATIGEEYNNSVRKFFPRPAKIDLSTSTGSKAALLHLIDTIEDLMLTINDSVLYYFKYDTFKKQYDESISYFRDFSVALRNADKESQQISPFLYDMLESLIYSCIDQKLKALTDEYNSRVDKIKQMNLLSDYIINNPGIDHKGGVPRGGTFIIVYYEVPPAGTPAGLASLSSNISVLNTLSRTATPALTTEENITKTTLAEATTINNKNMDAILKLFDSKELQLTSSQAATLKSLAVSKFNAFAGLTEQFRIPDKAVIADFYLPYLCCSNCAPVAYVFPKEDLEKLAIGLTKTDFCNNDTNIYTVSVSPVGGTLTDIAGGIVAGSLQFKPAGLAAGNDTLTYTLPDGRTTSVDVKITAAPVIDFSSDTATSPTIIRFSATGIDGKSVSWNFGDGGISTTASPTHTYQFDGDQKVFTVRLTVTDGPCIVTVEHSVTVKNPQLQVFTIEPTLFCSNDERTYTFKTDPPVKDIADVKNENGLLMDKDTNGSIIFSPFKQQLSATKQFHLELNGAAVDLAIIVADASFTMNITTLIDPATGGIIDRQLLLKAKHTDADKYHWDIFTNGRQLKVPDAPEAPVSYRKFDLGTNNTINIKLSITYKTPGDGCSDTKDYNLTPEIFKNHENKGEFDNNTPA